jgi:hypothetical protein
MTAVDRPPTSSRRATSHAAVRDLVAELGVATVATVRTELGVSQITAWRYLNELVDQRELDREWMSAERSWVYALPGEAPAPDVGVVDCSHKEVRHQHGTRLAYVLDGCRCTPCRQAQQAAAQVRNRSKAYGRSSTALVDAAPVRAHVQRLQAAGMGHKRVALVAGVNPSSVGRLIYGRRRQSGLQEPPTRRMNPDDARKLLAVPMPGVADLGATVNVDGTGARRRLQALARIGWSVSALARQADIDPQSLYGAMRGQPVIARTHQAVVALYERLWDQPVVGRDHAEKVAISRTINRARREGWAPPLAWDDENLDDPNAQPYADDVDEDQVDELAVQHVLTEGLRLRLSGSTLHAAVHALGAAGLPPAVIAERLGVHVRQVERLRARATPPRPMRRQDAA